MYVNPKLQLNKNPKAKIGMLLVDTNLGSIPSGYIEREMTGTDRKEDILTPVVFSYLGYDMVPLCEAKNGEWWVLTADGEIIKTDEI